MTEPDSRTIVHDFFGLNLTDRRKIAVDMGLDDLYDMSPGIQDWKRFIPIVQAALRNNRVLELQQLVTKYGQTRP